MYQQGPNAKESKTFLNSIKITNAFRKPLQKGFKLVFFETDNEANKLFSMEYGVSCVVLLKIKFKPKICLQKVKLGIYNLIKIILKAWFTEKQL
jgi:hypothetical protein